MKLDQETVARDIKRALVEIAERLGEDAKDVAYDELIPATGVIDSAGLLELLAWFESHFDITIPQDEITVDNLGSIELMAAFAIEKKGQ